MLPARGHPQRDGAASGAGADVRGRHIRRRARVDVVGWAHRQLVPAETPLARAHTGIDGVGELEHYGHEHAQHGQGGHCWTHDDDHSLHTPTPESTLTMSLSCTEDLSSCGENIISNKVERENDDDDDDDDECLNLL